MWLELNAHISSKVSSQCLDFTISLFTPFLRAYNTICKLYISKKVAMKGTLKYIGISISTVFLKTGLEKGVFTAPEKSNSSS